MGIEPATRSAAVDRLTTIPTMPRYCYRFCRYVAIDTIHLSIHLDIVFVSKNGHNNPENPSNHCNIHNCGTSLTLKVVYPSILLGNKIRHGILCLSLFLSRSASHIHEANQTVNRPACHSVLYLSSTKETYCHTFHLSTPFPP